MKAKKLNGKSISDFIIDYLPHILMLAVYVASILPGFIKSMPFDLLKRTAAYVIMALGMGCVIMVSGIDLSSGRIMGLTSLISMGMLQNASAAGRIFPNFPQPTVVTIVIAFVGVLIIGALIGAFNGLFITRFKVPAWCATISTQLILYGIMLVILSSGTYRSCDIANLYQPYKQVVTDTVKIGSWAIPNFVWYAIIIIVIMWLVWNKTKFGRNMRVVGTDREAAESMNISIVWTIIAAFMIAGACYGINGFIEAVRVGGPRAAVGSNAELDAIAACVLGGISLKGGRGSVGGIVIGVVLLQLLSVSLQWLSVSANVVYIIKGILILLVVVCDSLKLRRKTA